MVDETSETQKPSGNPRRRKKKAQRPAPSLSKAISRAELSDEQFDAAVAEFHEGSDRVAAIMGAALVESHLVQVLAVSLEDSSDRRALFEDHSAPFGTFKARIVAARAMGLCTAAMAADMDIIRDIRNQFAHALLNVTFDHAAVEQHCGRLSPYRFHQAPDRQINAARLAYETACWSISLHFLKTANRILAKKTISLKQLLAREAQEVLGVGTTNTLILQSIGAGERE